MVCIYCGRKTGVVNSRRQRRSNQVWRRRHCPACGATFTTVEAPQHELAWVVRRGSRSEPFLRDKLLLSLYRSCEHRTTALSDAAALTDTVMRKLAAQAHGGALESRDITQVVQVALNRFDTAASVHYQAYHKG